MQIRALKRLWLWYGPLITTVVEALVEFVLFVLILKGSRLFLNWAAPELSCDSFVDCIHTGGFLIVWLALVLAFVGYAVWFGYQRFKFRIRSLPEQLEQRLEAVESGILYNKALVLAIAAMPATATYTDRSTALELLKVAQEQLRERGLLDRRINLLMGRLYRRLRRYNQAIDVLSRFILEKEKRNQFDEDLADAYYNRACYRIILMQEAKNLEKQAEEKELAYEDLATSIKRNASNRLDAAQDEDFEPLWQEQRFKELVSSG